MWFRPGFQQNVPLFIKYMNNIHNGNFKMKKITHPPPRQQIRSFTFFMPFSIPYPMHSLYLVCCITHPVCVLPKVLYQPSICWVRWRTGGCRTLRAGRLVSVEELSPRGSIYGSKSLWAAPNSFLGICDICYLVPTLMRCWSLGLSL